jgi:hypothetical protein
VQPAKAVVLPQTSEVVVEGTCADRRH